MHHLHVLLVRHVGDPARIEALVPEHVAYLDRYHAKGVFLVSGQTAREADGGVIITRGASRAEVEQIVTEDPFLREGLSTYEIVTFNARRYDPGLAGLIGT